MWSKHVFWFTVTEHSYWQGEAEVTIKLGPRFNSFGCLYLLNLLKVLNFFIHLLQIKKQMLPTFTKYLSLQALTKMLESTERTDQIQRILKRIFEKSLKWLESKFDQESIKDAISRILIKHGAVKEDFIWIYILDGKLQHKQVAYTSCEYLTIQNGQVDNLILDSNSTYVYLTVRDFEEMKSSYITRENKRITKFIRKNIFYFEYIEDQYVNQFMRQLKIQYLPYKGTLKWENHSQMAVIYKGSISIQYKSKRNINITEVTKGMLIMNLNEQLTDNHACRIFGKEDVKCIKKFKYISKSEESILLIFDSNIFQEYPYNLCMDVVSGVYQKYIDYCKFLKNRLKFEEQHLYPNKEQIKKQIKNYETERFLYDSTRKIQSKHLSVIPRQYQSISLHSSLTNITLHTKQLSLSNISLPTSNRDSMIVQPQPTQMQNHFHIHNNWIQTMNRKKPKNIKSFSTLNKINLHRAQREKRSNKSKQEGKKRKQTNFFVSQQFIKKKLRIQFEGILSKLKNVDLSLNQEPQINLTDRVKRLEAEIESGRIVKLDKIRKKPKLLRSKIHQ